MSGGLPVLGLNADDIDLGNGRHARAAARMKRLMGECRHVYDPGQMHPCFSCIADMVLEYETRLGGPWDDFNAAMLPRYRGNPPRSNR